MGLLDPPPPDRHVQLAANALERYERGDPRNALQMMRMALRVAGVEGEAEAALEEISAAARRYADSFGNTLQWLEDRGATVDTGPINRVAAAADFFERKLQDC